MRKFVAAVIASLSLLTTPVAAAERISFDTGGSLFEYVTKYVKARETEQRFKIDGLCISACTMITGNIPKDRVCSTEYGILAFHSAYVMTPFGPMHSIEGTKLLGTQLSREVKEMLKVRGFDVDAGQEHSDLIYIKATDVYKVCN